MKKLFIHHGKGHYIGSTVIVYADSIEKASTLIRTTLDEVGLREEPLNIREIKAKNNSLIYCHDGDY